MEKLLTPDEKLRRAEEIYYQRRENRISDNKTVNVPVSNKHYILKRMSIQLVVCFFIYTAFFIIKNYNFIFSKEVVNKTNEMLSYDINLQEIYYKIANYINNYQYFSNKNNEIESKKETIEPIPESNYVLDASTEVKETFIDLNEKIEKVDELEEQIEDLSQMEIDAKEIKENYSIISPLKGVITSRYGPRTPLNQEMSSYHLGIDIAANTGTTIVSSMDGKVVYSGELGNYGRCIEIQTNDILIIYGHCSKLIANEGEMVLQGQKIAEVGETR